MHEQHRPTGLEILQQLAFAAAPQRILMTALQLDLFSLLKKGPAGADDVAAKVKCSARGTRMLLDALTGLDMLRKRAGRYELTDMSSQYLVRESADYCGSWLETDALAKAWDNLPEVVRTGRPAARVESRADAERFFPNLIRSLHVLNREPARVTAKHLCANLGGEPRVLDVACGSGVWGIACAEVNPKVRVTAHDFPAILELTNDYARRHKVGDRYDYLAGDLKQVDFGNARFDVALLGNIVHSEGEKSSRDLFKRLARAIKPGGKIAIVDMIPNEERTAPPFALLFAVNMLLNTETGDTYTLKEYAAWLKEAGFGSVETVDIHSHSPLIVATR